MVKASHAGAAKPGNSPVQNRDRYQQARILIEIESFVSDVCMAFTSRTDGVRIGQGPAESVLRELPRLLTFCEPQHRFSEHLDAFWVGCHGVGLLEKGQPTALAKQINRDFSKHLPLVQDFVDAICAYSRSKPFGEKLAERQKATESMRCSLQGHAKDLLDAHGRMYLVKANLRYWPSAIVDVCDVFFHLDVFERRLAKRKSPLDVILGHAWCLEQGTSAGYHVHAAFFVPPSCRSLVGIGRALDRAWRDCSDHLGSAQAHHIGSEGRELGLRASGMLDRDDPASRKQCLVYPGYLVDPEKDNHYLRIWPDGRQRFNTMSR